MKQPPPHEMKAFVLSVFQSILELVNSENNIIGEYIWK